MTNEIIGQLAQECDRVQNTDGDIYLLGSTSNPDQVDAEVLACFLERMTIPLPSKDSRPKLFTQLLSDKKIAFSLADGALFLAQITEGRGLGSRDLESMVQVAEQNALMRAMRNGGPEHYSLALEDFDSTQAL